MQVHTSVDEADVGNVRRGMQATFTVDAFPARRFRGQGAPGAQRADDHAKRRDLRCRRRIDNKDCCSNRA